MGVQFIPDTKETRYKLQQLARLKMITKLEADILMDIEVCEVEGWDKTEYVNQLKTVVNSYGTADRKTEPFDKDINVRSKTEPKPCEWCKFYNGEECYSQEPCKAMLYFKTES